MSKAMENYIIIKQYNDLMKNTDTFIIELMNILVNKKVLEMSKKSELPIEVFFFPKKQIPEFSRKLYEQIQSIKKGKTKLPDQSVIVENINELIKQTNPIVYKVIKDKKIDVYKMIKFDESLYF
jgi:hypothetical protein